MGVLPGVHLVDVSKVTGDSVDFYDQYARITELIQPIITADALQRAESGAPLALLSVLKALCSCKPGALTEADVWGSSDSADPLS